MITSATSYVGKSFKYLAIYDKSIRRLVQSARPEDGSLTVDYLVEILTPGAPDEIMTPITIGVLQESTVTKILNRACERFTTLINILQINYWAELSEIVRRKRKWNAVTLLAEILKTGSRNCEICYYNIVELCVNLQIMRMIGDYTDMSVHYEDIDEYIL